MILRRGTMEGKDKWNLLPYTKVDGIPTMRDSEIKFLYDKCFDEGVGRILFHDGAIESADQFLAHVKSFQSLFWAIFYEGKPFGFFWLNRLEKTHAYCHFVSYPDYWGKGIGVEAGKRAMAICTDIFPTIMGMIPSSNIIAIDYLKRVGLKEVGEIENLMTDIMGNPVTGTMLYITKEMLDESHN
jgi:RimJ/RimL family protein N-acetyltransferase